MAPHTLEEAPLEAQTKANSGFHRSYRLMMWIHISKFVNHNRERYDSHIPYSTKNQAQKSYHSCIGGRKRSSHVRETEERERTLSSSIPIVTGDILGGLGT